MNGLDEYGNVIVYRLKPIHKHFTVIKWRWVDYPVNPDSLIGHKYEGVKEKKRTWLDNILGRPIGLDNNWYVETQKGKVWLHCEDYIVKDVFGNINVVRLEDFDVYFERI